MRLLLCALLSLLASSAAAQVRCPDGKAPALTGEAFRPFSCERTEAETPAVSTETLPDPDAERADLRPLEGVWRGYAAFGGRRYDVTLTVSDAGQRWAWRTLDEQLQLTQEVDGRVSRGFFAKPPYKLELASPQARGRSLAGEVWLGAAPLEAGRHPDRDRLAVARFKGREPLQKLAYAVDGARLRAVYTLIDPRRGRVSTELELQRAP